MSFQAYLDKAEEQTGRTPQALVDEAAQRGLTRHAEVVAWLKQEYGLGLGHARAIAHVVVNGPTFDVQHTTGSHRDETGTLRLDGLAARGRD